MNNIKAVDIVLIPPKEIYDLSIELSNNFNRGIKPVIKLNDTHLPHITLVQMFIKDELIKELINVIDKKICLRKKLNSKIIGLTNGNTIGMDIYLSDELNNLYKTLMDLVKGFEEKGTDDSFFLDSEEVVNPGTIEWVTNYRNKSHYNPHITLAKDSIQSMTYVDEREFVADRLAICHLGNYCTCRKIIKEWKLSN